MEPDYPHGAVAAFCDGRHVVDTSWARAATERDESDFEVGAFFGILSFGEQACEVSRLFFRAEHTDGLRRRAADTRVRVGSAGYDGGESFFDSALRGEDDEGLPHFP